MTPSTSSRAAPLLAMVSISPLAGMVCVTLVGALEHSARSAVVEDVAFLLAVLGLAVLPVVLAALQGLLRPERASWPLLVALGLSAFPSLLGGSMFAYRDAGWFCAFGVAWLAGIASLVLALVDAWRRRRGA